MSTHSLRVSVDRVEGAVAVLESDDGQRFEVAARELNPSPREGMIYLVPLSASGTPRWSEATHDPVETERRRISLNQRMNRLRNNDPGSDIQL